MAVIVTDVTSAELAALVSGNLLKEGLQYNEITNGYRLLATSSSTYIYLESLPRKKYAALLTQSGTNAPVATILEDTITGLVWARSSAGTYTLTKTGAFVANKTVPPKDIYSDQSWNIMTITRTSADVMTLNTYAAADTSVLADNVLSSQYFTIEIYA